jgi:AraC-like DNA-binding protein
MGGMEVVRAEGINNSFPRHSHQSYCLGLVEKGCRVILHNGKATLIPEGGLFLLQPKQSHACRSPQAQSHSYGVLCLPEDLMNDLACQLWGSRYHRPVFSSIRLDDNCLADLFNHLLRGLAKGVSSSILDADVEKLASRLISRHASPPHSQQVLRPRPNGPEKQACALIESQFQQAMTLDALSKSVGLSPFHLQRRFVKTVGCSPKEYLLQHRIKMARQLLIKGLPLSQVALEIGFYDQGHFTNRFKTVTGVTPGRYLHDNQQTVKAE